MKYFLFSLLVLAVLPATAQQTKITVLINVSKPDSVPPATLRLLQLPDSNEISTQVARPEGNVFATKKLTKYLLLVSSTGYTAIEKTIATTDKNLTVTIALKKDNRKLDEVVIKSKKPLMKQEDDKTIVEAEVLANTSSNAYEVLEKIPGAIVDQDGNVYMSSMTPATIQINGRDVKLSAADLASLLKSLPAGSVSKVEMMRNPSAKYDAASSGGIVNIVLKKGVKIGSSGSMNVGWFQGQKNTKFAGFNVNKGGDKVSTYISYQFTDRNNFEELNSTRLLPGKNALVQKAYTVYPALNHYIGAGADVQLSKKFNIAYDMRLTANQGQTEANNIIDIVNEQQQIGGENKSIINNRNTSLYIGNNLSTKYKIDSAGSEWTILLDYNYFNYNNFQQYRNIYVLPQLPTLFGNGENNNRKSIFAVQSDLTLKLKKGITLETGFKVLNSASRNSALYDIQQGNSPTKIDSFQTNTFKYRERISSFYLQLSKKIWGLTIKPGVRIEGTDISGQQIIPSDTSLAIKRTDVFPYLYLRHKLVKLFGFDLNGNIVLRRSISRPYYEVLNPYPRYIDQYLFEVGNPNLQPQFTTNYEFNVTADDFTIFSWGINRTSNIFSNVTYQDDATGIAYRTYDNLGTNREVYLRIVGGIPPGGKYTFYAGAQRNFNTYEGVYQGFPLNFKRKSWLFFMYHQYKFSSSMFVSLSGFMRTKGVQNFYELDNFGSLNMSINKSFMKKTFNVILAFNDLLYTNKVGFVLQQGNVDVNGIRINDTRRVGLTLRYNFGIKPKEEKKPAFEQPAETRDN
jgi:iron complex outermembrane recepter protein